ncbi:penicillin-binding protein 1C [Janthinobacterium sp. HLX7-2]|uniref:penicillin-binding protein 1C n=1 Tax=Janthinobacterium sp. HLX7-2 TaxID=1259331 RepID=UPI003F1E7E74
MGCVLGGPACAQAILTPGQVQAAYRSSEAQLLDRSGAPLQSLRVDMKVRRLPWVPLADISPALQQAVLLAEDQRFMQHGGVDVSALATAAWDNLFSRKPRGASTITMQLAGQLDADLQAAAGGRSLRQKWKQMRAAQAIEESWSKAQIFEAYLNLVSFRGELQGVASASYSLFGKAPSGLNQTDSIILASLVRAPNAPLATVTRRACALAKESRMDSSCQLIGQRVQTALQRTALYADLAPAPQVAQQLLKQPGALVASTLDGPLQRFAQENLRQQLASLRERNVNDGAIIVLDNRSGEILAYVGNAGGSRHVDGVTARRQAGSTLKPFLYELAIERRLMTAASVMDDTPLDIATASGMYAPQNYDRNFKGYVSARTSLASSLNIPAVRTVLLTGQDGFYNRLKDVGLSSLTEPAEYYGPSLALGSSEVTLLELANAYRVLANGGQYSVASLQRGQAGTGKRRVMDPGAAFIVGDILADRAARSLTFGLRNELGTNFWSAVKTGTSKDMRDNWCMGYSARYTVGVWVGNFDGKPMWDVSGVTGAAPVWRDVMDYLHKNIPSHAPKAPPGVLQQMVAYRPALEAPRREWFISGTESAIIAVVGDTVRPPAIVYPAEDSILAIDPDIPPALQRVFFQAQGSQALRWVLDGKDLGAAAESISWRPVPGKHALALVNKDGKTLARVAFQVRGNALAQLAAHGD